MKVVFSAITLFFLLSPHLLGQKPPIAFISDTHDSSKVNGESKQLTIDEASKQLLEMRDKIKLLQAKLGELSNETEKEDQLSLTERIQKYQSIETNIERFMDNVMKKGRVKEEELLLKGAIEMLSEKPIEKSPPYSLTIYDGLLSDISVIRQRKGSNETEIELIKKSIDYNTENLEKLSKEYRSLKEKIEEKNGTEIPLTEKMTLEDQKLDIELIQKEILNKRCKYSG